MDEQELDHGHGQQRSQHLESSSCGLAASGEEGPWCLDGGEEDISGFWGS